ncbi:MAG: GAF domain-containing protein [Alphaproteobacteria bacterium]
MSSRPDPASVQRTLSQLADTIAEAKSNDVVFVAIADAAHVVIGHKLFTVMAFDAEAMEVSRVYSSNAQAYPPGGRKKKRDTAWGRQVLERGEPYIGYTADDICANFNDHEVILGLGLQSVLNMPVRYGGKTLGTMNLLHEFDFYSAKDLEVAALLAEMLVSSLHGEAGFQGDRT